MSYQGRLASLPTVEHVYNGGMELITAGTPNTPTGWPKFDAASILQSELTTIHSGAASLVFVSGAGAFVFKGTQSSTFTTSVGTKYYVSLWLRRTVSVGITILVLKGDGTQSSYSSTITPTLNTWYHHTGEFTESVGGSSARILVISNNGNLTCYVDDVSVTSRPLGAPDPFYKNDGIIKRPYPRSLISMPG